MPSPPAVAEPPIDFTAPSWGPQAINFATHVAARMGLDLTKVDCLNKTSAALAEADGADLRQLRLPINSITALWTDSFHYDGKSFDISLQYTVERNIIRESDDLGRIQMNRLLNNTEIMFEPDEPFGVTMSNWMRQYEDTTNKPEPEPFAVYGKVLGDRKYLTIRPVEVTGTVTPVIDDVEADGDQGADTSLKAILPCYLTITERWSERRGDDMQ
jgi:hypothetical protein